MKRMIAILALFFIIGWVARIYFPYQQAKRNRPDYIGRKQAIEILVNRLYQFANTNGGKFPGALDNLGEVTNGAGKNIDLSNYLFRSEARSTADEIDGRKIVVGENPLVLTNRNLYFLSVEGRYTITQSKSNSLVLLRENKLLQ